MSSRIGRSNGQPRRQRGAAILIVLLIVVMAGTSLFVTSLTSAGARLENNTQTAVALSQAKAALVGFAVSVHPLDPARPGDLPCPDLDNDGDAETSCGDATGSTGQTNRLGRLPWKTLGLPDLRDGNGERLWYGVSNDFKNNFRKFPLNSDSRGTITLRDSAGTIVRDGTDETAAVAVILSPGAVLKREDATGNQDRSCSRGGAQDPLCLASERCSMPNPTTTAKCSPINYLDISIASEDNANFVDNNGNGFISGDIKDANNTLVVNDKVIVVAREELVSLMNKRVAKEALGCLQGYAAMTNNGGRYPWTSPLDPSSSPSYVSSVGSRFGRLPDPPFSQTLGSNPSMSPTWPAGCRIDSSPTGWWHRNKWAESVFFGVAAEFSPGLPPPPPCGACMTVDPTFGANKRLVVVAAGTILTGQARSSDVERGSIDNYLEGQNATPSDNQFLQSKRVITFNDDLLFIQ